MVALIVKDEIEPGREMLPEREIGIDGKTVAMAQHQPRTLGIAMAPDAQYRPVGHRKIDTFSRPGNNHILHQTSYRILERVHSFGLWTLH
jgi:hypothetical protein